MNDPASTALLPPDLRRLVHESERLYERIQRLERAWRGEPQPGIRAIDKVRQRVATRIGS